VAAAGSLPIEKINAAMSYGSQVGNGKPAGSAKEAKRDIKGPVDILLVTMRRTP
jgi:hypothetical protein